MACMDVSFIFHDTTVITSQKIGSSREGQCIHLAIITAAMISRKSKYMHITSFTNVQIAQEQQDALSLAAQLGVRFTL